MQEGERISLWARLFVCSRESVKIEVVDAVICPCFVEIWRECDFGGKWLEGPVFLKLSAFVTPTY